jgi:hypothetical protein
LPVDETVNWLLAHGWTRPPLIETYHDTDPPACIATAREYLLRLLTRASTTSG